MPQRVKPTAKQKRNLAIHFLIFAIGVIVMVMIHHKQGEHHWAYPWHAWLIAAWSLSFLGHFCVVFFSQEDKGYKEYKAMEQNG